jgi:hypothetical protein
MLRRNLTDLATGNEPPSFTFELNMLEPLHIALGHCSLALGWCKRIDGAAGDFDSPAEEVGVFPDPKQEWVDAVAKAPSGVDIFFLKSSLGRVRHATQRASDRAKVVMAAACGAWEAMQRVPPHKRDLGLGCIAAHLYEEDSKGAFRMDVYYVGYNAVHCCFECQRLTTFPVPTDVCTRGSLITAVYALVAFQAVAVFVQEQDLYWHRAFLSNPPGTASMEDRYEPEAQRVERYCKEHSIEVKLPEFAFVRASESHESRVREAVRDVFTMDASSMKKSCFSAVWKGEACSDASPVALKLQSNRHHLSELSALFALQDVPGVVQIRASYPVGNRNMLLVSDWLQRVSYETLRRSDAEVLQFAWIAIGIVASIHERHVFHCAIEPSVFMRKGELKTGAFPRVLSGW